MKKKIYQYIDIGRYKMIIEFSWEDFNRNNELVSKYKKFKSQRALERFIEKLAEKDNFYKIYGISHVCEW